jgi:TldD protein
VKREVSLLDDDNVPGLRPEDAILAQWAVDEARRLGADYADARWGLLETLRIRFKNGRVAPLARTYSRGLGLRVVVDGAWGFASHPLLPVTSHAFVTGTLDGGTMDRDEMGPDDEDMPPISSIDDIFEAEPSLGDAAERPGMAPVPHHQMKEVVENVASQACALARAASASVRRPVRLAPAEPQTGFWRTPCERDPFLVPLEEIIEVLSLVESAARRAEKGLVSAEALMTAWRRAHWLCTSEGTLVLQDVVECGGGMRVLAHRGGITQERSFPGLRGNHAETGGYERFLALGLVEAAGRIASEAAELTTAPPCPSVTADLVIDGATAAVQIHETVGHAVELDRVLGAEESLAGGSHLTPGKMGWFRFGSDIVNVVADATSPHGLGTFGFDDEGTPASRHDVIRNGIFSGYLSSRDTGARLGIPSGGSLRGQDWSHLPLIRMTNVNLLPGGWEFEEILRDTERGFYFETPKNPSIDHQRLNFFLPAEIAWEIRDGKRVRMFRDPSYGGISHKLWRSCDAIADGRHWRLWGIPSCGKGDPGQTGHVGHGASPLRMRGVRLGTGPSTGAAG